MTIDEQRKLYGRRVRIVGITDLGDTDLNGKTGLLCAKHFMDVPEPRTVLGDIGIVLDGPEKLKYANLNYGEFEEIKKHVDSNNCNASAGARAAHDRREPSTQLRF